MKVLPTDIIWRYTSIFNILHLIQTESYFLNQLGEMEDSFEGQLKGSYFIGKNVPAGRSKKSTKINNDDIKKRIEIGVITAHNTYISSWTNEKIESITHWKIFTSPVDGIVIKSTIERVLSCIESSNIVVAKIEYLPGGIRRIVNPFNIKEIITTKLKYYSNENEIRFYLLPNDILTNSSQKYVYLKCVPEILIEELRFSPLMEEWKIKLLTDLLIKVAPYLQNKIKTSNIVIRKQNISNKD